MSYTQHNVPADTPFVIRAGWNRDEESYYGLVHWKGKQEGTLGALEYECGHPIDSLPELADLVAHLSAFLDWKSPDLVRVFHELLGDKLIARAAARYADYPNRHAYVPDLIGMVLDRDFTPVDPQWPHQTPYGYRSPNEPRRPHHV